MEWIKTDLSLPPELAVVYRHIRGLEPNVCIAGGFFSDQYMGYAPKDVDVFVKFRDEATCQAIINRLLSIGAVKEGAEHDFRASFNYRVSFIDRVINHRYEGHKIQLIFSHRGVLSAKSFDFRFREFVYVRGAVFATSEAIADIKAKRLVIAMYHSPIRSLARGCRFSFRYGFNWDEKSLSVMAAIINNTLFPSDVQHYASLSLSLEPEALASFKGMFENRSGLMNLKNVAHDESLNVKFLRSTIESTYLPTRDEVDAVLSKPIIPGEVERDFELPAFIGADMWKRACQKFAALVRKNRLKLLFELEGDKMDLLLAETQNLLKPDTSLSAFAALRDIFYEPFTGWGINGCGGHELENAHQLLHRLRHKMVIRYSKNPNILGSDELRWFARYDPIGMLLVTKEDIGSVIGGFSIDETTGKFLVATIPAEIQDDTDALKDLVRTYYEVYREEKKQNEIRELAGSIV